MKLHIGCGPIYLDGWTNIDISPSHKTDICGDVLTMDFQDVEDIYSCHMIEHFKIEDAVSCFGLFFKWLKEGGILRLAVPDLELAAKAYASGSDMKFLYGADFKGYYIKDTPCERFNFFMKAWEHKMVYDYNQLSSMLFDAGFRGIIKYEPNCSGIPNFSHDRFISESLYIEAIK